MKINWKYFFLLVMLLYRPSTAQLDTVEFFQRVNSLYYTVESCGLQNFSMWVTSDFFRENIDSAASTQEYPWEIIWVRPNKIFFIKRPLFLTGDSTKFHLAQKLQLEMQQELKGLIIDWQRFYGGSILADLPPHYNLIALQDTILLKYESREQDKKMDVCQYFGQNGVCLKVRFKYVDSGQEIYIYPVFNYIDIKWLCSGWQVQMLENNEVSSGFIVQIFSEKINTCWLPKKIIMQLQTKKTPAIIFKREYEISNIITNRSIKVVE
jgi:hypothetical protein